MKTKPSTVHSACKTRSSATENQPQHTGRWLDPVLPSCHLSLFPQVPRSLALCALSRVQPTISKYLHPLRPCGYQDMEDSKAAPVYS